MPDCSVEATTIKSLQTNSTVGGGIVGSLEYEVKNASITACRFSGTIATGRVGGIAGTLTFGGKTSCSGTIAACYASGSLSSNYKFGYVGGVVGSLFGDIVASYFVGTIGESVTSVQGGVVGRQVTYSYDNVTVNSTVNGCCWQASSITNGIGQKGFVNGSSKDQPSDEGTTKVTDKWDNALTAMNTALTGKGYQYVQNTGTDQATFPLHVQKVQ